MVIRELIWKAIAERGDDGERQVADHLRRWAIANGAAQLPPSPVPPTLRIAIRDASGNSYVIRFRFVPRVRAPFQRYFPGRTALAVRAVDRATLELLREPDLATLKYEFEGKPYETREALLVAIEDRESEWRLR